MCACSVLNDVVIMSDGVEEAIGMPHTPAPPHHLFGDKQPADFQLSLYPIELIVPPSRPTRRGGGAPSGAASNGNEGSSALSLSNARRRSVVGIAGGARKLQLPSPSGYNGNGSCGSRWSATNRLSEPVLFDPFTGVDCAHIIMQPPSSNQHARRDDATVVAFRRWVAKHFPAVVQSLEALQAIQKRRKRRQPLVPPHLQVDKPPTDTCQRKPRSQCNEEGSGDRSTASKIQSDDDVILAKDPNGGDDDDESESEGEGEASLDGLTTDRETLRQARDDAWALLFEHAKLIALAPEDEFVIQGCTRAGDVFFVLTGVCDLSFRPDFLPVLLTEKERDRRRQQQQQQQSIEPQDRPNSPVSPQSPTKKQCLPRHDSPEGRRMERRLSLTCLSRDDVRRVEETALHIRSLTPGDFFGLDAALFQFAYHLVTATSRGARQRNPLGVTVPALMHVLRVPSAVLQRMRKITCDAVERAHIDHKRHRTSVSSGSVQLPQSTGIPSKLAAPEPSNAFPYRFDSETVTFLRETFLFATMSEARLQFLAAHMRPHRVRKHEFLFTTGQRVSVFLVRSGQLTLCASEAVRTVGPLNGDPGYRSRDGTGPGCTSDTVKTASSRRYADNIDKSSKMPTATVVESETRTVELEILQAHDTAGLLEACLLQESFTRYCIATTSDVRVFVVSPVALLAALAQEAASASLVADLLLRRHAWYSLRLFTSRNQHNPQREFKLSLGAQQRRSPLPCSRCGWTGHSSTSSICLRAESLRAAIANRPLTSPGSADGDGGVVCTPPADDVAGSEAPFGADATTSIVKQRGRGRLFHSVQLAAMAVLPPHNPNALTTDRVTAPEVSTSPPPPSSSWLDRESDAPGDTKVNVTAASSVERREQRLEQSRQRLDDALQSADMNGNGSSRATTAPSCGSHPTPRSPQTVRGSPRAPTRRPGTQLSPRRPHRRTR